MTTDLALTKENVREVLKGVDDPELGVNIVDLGLIYEVAIDETEVNVLMTLTTPFCPVGPQIKASIDQILRDSISDVTKGSVEFTFNPPWDKDMMSEDAKEELGIW